MPRKVTNTTTPKTRTKKIETIDDDFFKKPTVLISQIKTELKYKNETQKKMAMSIRNNDVTICTGPAGTGKSYVACIQALNELKNNENIKKIVLVKSVTTLKSEEIGFLKGTMEEKMEPFMYSFVGNFEKIIGKGLYEKLKTGDYIEILPIAYLRGVNIDNAIVIIDEVQNISIDNIRTILTRLGENSKMVFLGDVKQIDSKNKYDSALSFLMKHFKDVNNIGTVEYSKDDIVRHPLVKVIEDIFDSVNDEELKLKSLNAKNTTNQINQRKVKKASFLKRLLKSLLK
jgi:phosphate starvation-inducible PhoH-like protein